MKSMISIQDGNVVYTVLLDSTEKEVSEWTKNLHSAVKEQFNKTGPVKILADLTKITFADSFKIRNLISEMEKKNEPYVLKSAAFTPDIKIRWLSVIIAKMSGRRNFAIFKTKEKALMWLDITEKDQVLKETFYLTYNYMKDKKEGDEIEVLNHVRKVKNYSNSSGEVMIDFFNIQQGVVYVTFHYLKENPSKGREEALKYIKDNYTELLNKYYLMGK